MEESYSGLALILMVGIVISSVLVLVIVLTVFAAFDSKRSNNSLPSNSSVKSKNKYRTAPASGQISALHSAVETNDYQKVKSLLKHGIDPDSGQNKNKVGEQERTNECDEFTPLYFAIENGNYKMAKLLLNYGADPNGHYLYVLSPLYSAIQLRRHDIMQLLIDFGADVNGHGGSKDEPCLIQTIHNCDVKAAEILLKNGADPKAANASGSSALNLSKSRAQAKHLSSEERAASAEIAQLLETYLKKHLPQGE